MAKKHSRPDRALITGASTGIGRELAKNFAGGGADVVLVARSKDKLESLASELAADFGIEALVMPADLLEPDAPRKLASSLRRRRLDIDILVNNAGILEAGPFLEHGIDRYLQLVQLNVATVTHMAGLFLPAMVDRGHGRVLNVASLASFQPVPNLAVYAATKAYVLSLTESLSEELKGSGVTITALCPGLTDTNMVAQVQAENERLTSLPGFLISDVGDVAKEGYDAAMKGEVIRVPGIANLVTSMTTRAVPKWLVRAAAGIISRQAM